MAYATWHDYGVGIRVGAIKTTISRLVNFICLAAGFKDEVEQELGQPLTSLMAGYEEDNTLYGFQGSAYLEHPDRLKVLRDALFGIECTDSLGTAIMRVISELEGISLECCGDDRDRYYVIFPSKMIWNYGVVDRSVTEDGLRAIFEKYLKFLTDQSLDDLEYGAQEIGNGG